MQSCICTIHSVFDVEGGDGNVGWSGWHQCGETATGDWNRVKWMGSSAMRKEEVWVRKVGLSTFRVPTSTSASKNEDSVSAQAEEEREEEYELAITYARDHKSTRSNVKVCPFARRSALLSEVRPLNAILFHFICSYRGFAFDTREMAKSQLGMQPRHAWLLWIL